jgi:hypothetical protein
MTNDVDYKAVVKESGENAVAEDAGKAAAAFNSVDILKSQLNGKDEIKGTASASVAKDLLGKLDIEDKLGNKLEDWGKFKNFEKQEQPLNKTETMLLNNMRDAIRSGGVEKVQEMLGALSENPKSVDRVLRALKAQMEKDNPLSSVNWETGRDNNGNEFVRLNMYQANDYSKSAGGTTLTIGSDGRNSATYNHRYDSPTKPMDVNDALRSFSNYENNWKRPPIEIEPYPIKPNPWEKEERLYRSESTLKKN